MTYILKQDEHFPVSESIIRIRMSMAICDKCENFIDTDLDPDSTYFEMRFICESCRENLTPDEQAEHERVLKS